jgi:hypothetical protein
VVNGGIVSSGLEGRLHWSEFFVALGELAAERRSREKTKWSVRGHMQHRVE